MDKWIGRVALVTGASSGIGSAIAERMVKAGIKVVGCARNIKPIQDLADKLQGQKGCLSAVQCDLQKDEDIMSLFASIKDQHGGVDICVNSAGLGIAAPLLSGSSDQWRTMMEVNVIALCACSREAYKSMRERSVDDGHIIHISSLGAHMVPRAAESHFYSASKWAVKSILEGMRMELKDAKTNIRVTGISPGLVETEFAGRMRGEETAKAMYTRIKPLQASDIADAVEYALSAKPHVQVHDVIIWPTQE